MMVNWWKRCISLAGRTLRMPGAPMFIAIVLFFAWLTFWLAAGFYALPADGADLDHVVCAKDSLCPPPEGCVVLPSQRWAWASSPACQAGVLCMAQVPTTSGWKSLDWSKGCTYNGSRQPSRQAFMGPVVTAKGMRAPK